MPFGSSKRNFYAVAVVGYRRTVTEEQKNNKLFFLRGPEIGVVEKKGA